MCRQPRSVPQAPTIYAALEKTFLEHTFILLVGFWYLFLYKACCPEGTVVDQFIV